MTIQEWLNQNNYAVARQPRGFTFENELGEACFVQVLALTEKVTRHINERDIYTWAAKEIKRNPIFNDAARNSWQKVKRP